jgi:3-isopropylmalate/(R)-2-methylmalate dehydratase large subunit
MSNMAIECGAKNGIFEADDITLDYIKGRTERKPLIYKADPDAKYEREIVKDVSEIGPLVAWPHSPDNVRPVSESVSVKLDQVFIGSCTNGRLEDLAQPL